jgi:penicillin-insensitive murein DD-endopeptidase
MQSRISKANCRPIRTANPSEWSAIDRSANPAQRRLEWSAVFAAWFMLLLLFGPANAQDKGTLNPVPLPPLAKLDDPNLPAKQLFGRQTTPTPTATRSIGFYAKGCLAGAVALPVNGATWQVMRLSRNRFWGHPNLIEFIERLADKASTIRWPGLLLGDMSQPRGGPMLAGHASHQVGLDVDIWLTPMPDHRLTREDREQMMAMEIVAADGKDVDPKVWTPVHVALIKAAAEDPQVQRIFVNAAIKKALCRDAGNDRAWLQKVQPWWGHDWHFHVRLLCPEDSPNCEPQLQRDAGDGCHGKELTSKTAPLPQPDSPPPTPRRGPRMADLPAACREIVIAP